MAVSRKRQKKRNGGGPTVAVKKKRERKKAETDPTRGVGRVVLQRPGGVNDSGKRLRPPNESHDKWRRDILSGKYKGIHPVVRLTADGVDWGAQPRPGDEVGYAMGPDRTDDCLPTAIATATQVPIEQVPDPHISDREKRGDDPDEISRMFWERIVRWASSQGLTVMFHPPDEIPAPRRRWIGVVQWPEGRDKPFTDHCVVMDHDKVIFDPSCGVKPPPGTRMFMFTADQITYGISFDPKED